MAEEADLQAVWPWPWQIDAVDLKNMLRVSLVMSLMELEVMGTRLWEISFETWPRSKVDRGVSGHKDEGLAVRAKWVEVFNGQVDLFWSEWWGGVVEIYSGVLTGCSRWCSWVYFPRPKGVMATKSMASEVDAPKPSDYSLSTSNCDRLWMDVLGFIWRKRELPWDNMG